MKKFFLLAFCVALIIGMSSCGGNKEENKEEGDGYGELETSQPDPHAEALELMAESDCKTCHHVSNPLVGPSFNQVAAKYEFTAANVEMLGDKILNGGIGNWGQVQMLPHTNFTKEDAEKIARYVLSLDGETEQ